MAKDTFRNDGSLFEGALKKTQAGIKVNKDTFPFLRMLHTAIVLNQLKELLENTDGLRDKLMTVEAPKN